MDSHGVPRAYHWRHVAEDQAQTHLLQVPSRPLKTQSTSKGRMTPEAQRKAIGEACGWTRIGMCFRVRSGKDLLGSVSALHGTPPRDKDKPEDDQAFEPVPDYPGDLNACHEMEKVLKLDQNNHYKAYLIDIVFADASTRRGICCATAAQRCEAFLKTLNLWVPPLSDQSNP